MTVTLTLSDILLLIITLAVAGVAVYLVAVLRRMGTALGEFQKTVARMGEVLPRIEKVAEQAEKTLGSIDTLAMGAARAVDDVTVVTAVTRAVVEEGAEQVAGAMAALGQIGAVVGGMRAGWECLTHKEPEADEDGREDEARAPQEE